MGSQLPPDKSFSLVNATAVAIDKDKNSLQAFRWAIDNLTNNNPLIVLIHVTHRNHQNGEAQLLFYPLRPYCVRKRVQAVEVFLDDVDVTRAILDYIIKNSIGSIAVGSSSRNALTRKFRSQDVPSSLLKMAPNFCSVYVIAKGKLVSSRTANRPPPASSNAMVSAWSVASLKSPVPQGPGQEDGDRKRGQTGKKTSGPSFEKNNDGSMRGLAGSYRGGRNPVTRGSMDSVDFSFCSSRTSVGDDSVSDASEFSVRFSFGSVDDITTDMDNPNSPGSLCSESSAQPSRDLEAEMRRLRLELKQTMDLYSTACKEALSAKKMADEAQKLAEKEAQKRKRAEMKAKQEAEEKNRALNALAHSEVRYRRYAFEEIEKATNNFVDSMKIGEGGYGPVYKGRLDNTPVAIKMLRPDAAQGMRQFQQEIEVLCTMRHPNLVLLLGACPDYGCLVYEYMDYGSLEDRLFQKDNTPPLSWRIRFKIAAEIATGLLFLHQSKPEPLVHRDLKPANILLDHNYVSKISDVGLARLVPASIVDSVTQYHMTSAAGTFCYIDPEYQQTGQLTTRSDLFSLGILFLQIITARPPIGLAHRVGKAIERGKFADVLDKAVPDWPVEDALRFAKLALKCAELRKRDRPSLASVIVPELNRLRDLGQGTEPQSSRGDYQRPPDSK